MSLLFLGKHINLYDDPNVLFPTKDSKPLWAKVIIALHLLYSTALEKIKMRPQPGLGENNILQRSLKYIYNLL